MQTIYSQKAFPLQNSGFLSVYATNGQFRAVIVPRTTYYSNPGMVNNMLSNAYPTKTFMRNLNSFSGDNVVVLEPANGVLSFNITTSESPAYSVIARTAGTPMQPMMNYFTTAYWKSWWDRTQPMYRYITLIVLVLILGLIIWGIWAAIKSRRMSSGMTIGSSMGMRSMDRTYY